MISGFPFDYGDDLIITGVNAVVICFTYSPLTLKEEDPRSRST